MVTRGSAETIMMPGKRTVHDHGDPLQRSMADLMNIYGISPG